VIATDVYTWKLLRRDMGRSAQQTRLVMRALVAAALDRFGAVPGRLFERRWSGSSE
jgi:hypothetical protein